MDKIICVGKNYPNHAAELGEAHPEKPVIFLKPSSVLRVGTPQTSLSLNLPEHSTQVHHELELVFRINRSGSNWTIEQAQQALDSVTVGLDMTLRDLQTDAKKKGTPWTTSKVFIDSAVIGPWVSLADFPNHMSETFTLTLNDNVVQRTTGQQMSHSPAECLAYVSQFFPICAGDLLFTGTPAGVGPVYPGDQAILQFGPIHFAVHWTQKH